MLLYNLKRNVRDRVARASGVLLASVSAAYLADIFVGLEPGDDWLETWFRLQWIGVAFLPAAMFHLSDALLDTTGRPSRGRRRKAVRALYGFGAFFTISALSTDWLIHDLVKSPVPHMESGPLFLLYVAYFFVAVGVSMVNVIRAWKRCLTTYTRRRMTYLMASFWTPAWGIFPYSLLFSVLPNGMGAVPEELLWITFNVANLAVLGMLAFMSYPLSFFGERKPDRIVRLELLQFMLSGPLTGMLIVIVIQSFPTVEEILGLNAQTFMTFTVVGAVLCMQWGISLAMPILQRRLIYTQDQQQARLFLEFSQRLLTRADIEQLLEATLAAICDQLRVPTAFVASLFLPAGPRLEQYVGFSDEDLQIAETGFVTDFATGEITESVKQYNENLFRWRNFWLIPLRYAFEDQQGQLLGLLGVWARNAEPDLTDEEVRVLDALTARTADILTDVRLQTQIFDTIESLLPDHIERQNSAIVNPTGRVETLPGDANPPAQGAARSIVSSEDFPDMVRDVLRYYWGGSKLSQSELLKLKVVDEAAANTDGNRVNALRQVLNNAIEHLKPEGQQSFTRTDWTFYNILQLRFLQGRKVRDTARRLTMSQSDFYRKQRAAIEEVARIIVEQESAHWEKASVTTEAPESFEEFNEIPN